MSGGTNKARRDNKRGSAAKKRRKRDRIIARDKGICQICGEAVRFDVEWPHPLSATIDHIVPFGAGGGFGLSNLQLAHHACNHSRGDKS